MTLTAPLTTEDKLEIAELAARYNHAVDHRDAEAWADLFTPDGRVEVNGGLLAESREGLRAYVENARQLPAKRRHWICNVVVDEGPAPGTARLRLYVNCYDITDGAVTAPYMLGEYDDEVVRHEGRWKFRVRRQTTVAGRSATVGMTRPLPAADAN